MSNSKLNDYYQRDTSKEDAVMYRAGVGLQSAELNDQRNITERQIRRIADQIMVDGAVMKGGAVVIDANNGATTCAPAEVYLRGAIRDVPEKTFNLPTVGNVELGVWLTETLVDELDDPNLRDPAEGTRNYGERGAGRRRVTVEWGLASEEHTGNFYRVFEVENAVLKKKSAPPDMTGFNNALARYDRDNNGGHYVINGLQVVWLAHDNSDETYSVLEGKAHVNGYEIELPTALRLTFPYDPDLQTILSEPHQYSSRDGGKVRINVDRAPIHDIQKINITKQKKATIQHGSYAGVADLLPDAAVIEILSVKQGGTTYRMTQDYLFNSGGLDWSPSGQEPSPGSSYEVTYKYITQTEAIDPDEEGFSVEGAVDGSLVLVDYQWCLPRIDTVTIDRNGRLTRIKGMPHRSHPKAIAPPSGQLELALLAHTWRKEYPTAVHNTAIAAVSMGTLQDMKSDILDLYDLVAIERLKSDAIASAPAATRGVFVDPFQNDAMRDLGQGQTAAIVNGELVLPLEASIQGLDEATAAVTLPWRQVVLIEQTARTGKMKINPYSAFTPVPATVHLMPPVDAWTETQTVNGATVTQRFSSSWGLMERVTERTERRTVGTRHAAYLRPIAVKFVIDGFQPLEVLQSVIFDGVSVEVRA